MFNPEIPLKVLVRVLSILLFFKTLSAFAQQAYCWEPCQFECPQMGPRLCPPENILTYYDCCPMEGCCQYIKWPNLLFLLFIIFLLLAGCCCCAFFLVTDARQRMFQKQQKEERERQIQRERQSHAVYPSNGRHGGGGGTGLHHKKQSTIV